MSRFYPRPVWTASHLGCDQVKSQGWVLALLVGGRLTCGTLPKVHGVAGPPLESRFQGLVSVSPGCRET